MQDYQGFADISSFQDRVDMHHTVLTNVQAGTYYVAVYNNDAYFKVCSNGPCTAVTNVIPMQGPSPSCTSDVQAIIWYRCAFGYLRYTYTIDSCVVQIDIITHKVKS